MGGGVSVGGHVEAISGGVHLAQGLCIAGRGHGALRFAQLSSLEAPPWGRVLMLMTGGNIYFDF
jgi:hypothetical protein